MDCFSGQYPLSIVASVLKFFCFFFFWPGDLHKFILSRSITTIRHRFLFLNQSFHSKHNRCGQEGLNSCVLMVVRASRKNTQADIHTHKSEMGMSTHTLINENAQTQLYLNTDSRAGRHYNFGCHWRASSMNCSDQRNASVISPICAWPYIYITFLYLFSEGLANLGQHRGKCKRGQELGAEWRIDWFLWQSWLQFFFF